MKVYVTGVGAVSPLGADLETTFRNLISGQSATKFVPEYAQVSGLKSHVLATVDDLDVSKIPRKTRRSCSKMSLMSVLAAQEAIEMSGLSQDTINQSQSLICMGSTTGSTQEFYNNAVKFHETQSTSGQLSTTVFKVMSHTAATNVAIHLGFNGGILSTNAACASGNQAIVLGHELIKSGLYDIVITGGSEEAFKTNTISFDLARAASTSYNDRPEMASRPFDQDRDGLVASEGAGIIILESQASVQKRGAKVLAEILGGFHKTSSKHITQLDRDTMRETMERALINSQVAKDEVDYVNCHATATIQGDLEEAWAIKNCFNRAIPLSSLKGQLGHSFGACSSIETAIQIKMFQQEVILPTHNLHRVDEAMPELDFVEQLRKQKIKTVLKNSFAFGGICSSFVIRGV